MPSDIFTILPSGGTGNTSVTISATLNPGRNQREIEYQAVSTSTDPQIISNRLIVTQLGGASITMTLPSRVPVDGGTVTYSGTANLSSLTLSGDLLELCSGGTVNGEPVTKAQLQQGYEVDGDPGATGEYSLSLTFVIGPNSDVERVITGVLSGDLAYSNLSVNQEGVTQESYIEFTSNIVSDINGSGNVAVTLKASGTGYSDNNSSRVISVLTTPETVGFQITED